MYPWVPECVFRAFVIFGRSLINPFAPMSFFFFFFFREKISWSSESVRVQQHGQGHVVPVSHRERCVFSNIFRGVVATLSQNGQLETT